jgi:hypothetical protein
VAIGVAVLAAPAPRARLAAPIRARELVALARGAPAGEPLGRAAPGSASPPGDARCGERGQHRLRRGYAERTPRPR